MAKIKKAKTLLENLQQGKEGAKNSSFTFGGNIKVFERKEIIMPYLSQLDQKDIRNNLLSYRFNPQAHQSSEEYVKLIPAHLSNDIYSLYVNDAENVRLDKLTASNKLKHKIIGKINKSNMKILTNGSHLKTMILTKELCNYVYEILRALPEEEKEKMMQQMQNSSNESDGEGEEEGEGEGQGEGDGESQQPQNQNQPQKGAGSGDIDRQLDDIFDNSKADQQLDQALQNAENTIKKIEESGLNVDEQDMNQVREIVGKMDQLDAVKRELEQIAVSRATLGKAVEKILDNSINFFTRKSHEHEVPLIEADEVIDIEGIEFVHPIFKNTAIFDMGVVERTYTGQFDLYVDNSGSMGSSCMVDQRGKSISSMTLAKALALHMRRMNLLKDLYEFQGSVTKLGNSELAIFDMAARGGTSIDAVLANVGKTGRNSIILTDGEDNISYYHPKVFFLGVAGVKFHSFKNGSGGYRYGKPQLTEDVWEEVDSKSRRKILATPKAGQMFLRKKQCCIFDGKNLTYPDFK